MSWNPDYKSNDQENVIFTDEFRTKDLLWEFYYGFLENFRAFVSRKIYKSQDKIARAGCISQGTMLMQFVDNYFEEFKDEFTEEEQQFLKEFQERLPNPEFYDEIEDNDIYALNGFLHKAMKILGITNIVRETKRKLAAELK